ncbi:MAG: IS4 family transposase [Deltaproteobacteria bacterium]|nr:IS4 family transposase [Deltaproteobacteria bacterium]
MKTYASSQVPPQAPAAGASDSPPFSFADELRDCRFGDKRLVTRAVRIADASLAHPESSIPTLCGTASQAEGLYRFVANPAVSAEEIVRVHGQATLERTGDRSVLVISDSSTFGYGKDSKRTGLGPTTDQGQGFMAHTSLVVDEATGMPLGLLAVHTWVRPPDVAVDAAKLVDADGKARYGTKRGKPRKKPAKKQDDPTNESARWLKQALLCSKLLGDRPHIHISDRESDIYMYIDGLVRAGRRFVARVNHDRATAQGHLFEVLDGQRVEMTRTVHVGQRATPKGTEQRKVHPERAARETTLAMSAGTVTMLRGSKNPRTCAKQMQVNVVLVREIDPPADVEPIVWRLYTSEPVDTAEAIARVVDAYMARWLTEELYKALKTGCSFLDHQLESYEALRKLLSVLLVVAWKLLALRTVARVAPQAPATAVLTPLQVRLLKALHDRDHPKSPLPSAPTAKQAVYAVAGLAGHFKSNGDPGWQTIGRGLQRLLQAEHDYHVFLDMHEANAGASSS